LHSKAKLATLRRNDEIKREKADARNTLEAYLYEVKNKMMEHEEDVAKVSTEVCLYIYTDTHTHTFTVY
jgi:hypothetical protein